MHFDAERQAVAVAVPEDMEYLKSVAAATFNEGLGLRLVSIQAEMASDAATVYLPKIMVLDGLRRVVKNPVLTNWVNGITKWGAGSHIRRLLLEMNDATHGASNDSL